MIYAWYSLPKDLWIQRKEVILDGNTTEYTLHDIEGSAIYNITVCARAASEERYGPGVGIIEITKEYSPGPSPVEYELLSSGMVLGDEI